MRYIKNGCASEPISIDLMFDAFLILGVKLVYAH
jgi:hypothetical protein